MRIRISLRAAVVAVVIGWTMGWALARWLPRPVPVVPGKFAEDLSSAARVGDEKAVRALLDDGGDPNATERHGFTPLHFAAGNGRAEVVKVLLAHHANVNAATADEAVTPLQVAALRGEVEIMENLIAHRAELEAKSAAGKTPLFFAVAQGRLEAVRFLLQRRAQVSAVDNEGCTPLHLAAWLSWREIEEALLAGGADVNAAARGAMTPLATGLVTDGPEIQDLRNVEHVVTAMNYDAWPDPPWPADKPRARRDAMEVLLAHKADVNASSDGGWTPLHRAAFQHYWGVVELLLAWHADPNARIEEPGGLQGWTPLHWACISGGHEGSSVDDRNETIRSLLQHHADPNARNEKGETPLELADRRPGLSAKLERIFKEEAAAAAGVKAK